MRNLSCKFDRSNYFYMIRKRVVFKDKVEISYYLEPKVRKPKQFKPCKVYDEDIGDYIQRRLDLNTGEITDYDRATYLRNFRSVKSNAWNVITRLLDANNFDWFVTLTFDNNIINRYDDEAVYNAYSKWIRVVKRECPNVRYLAVIERHKEKEYCKDRVIHFHILMGNITAKQLHLVDSGKVCCSWLSSRKYKGNEYKYRVCSKEYYEKTKSGKVLTSTDGIPVYNIFNFIYGFTSVTRVQSQGACRNYVKKYLVKDLSSTKVFKKNYFYSQNLERPIIEKDRFSKEQDGYFDVLSPSLMLDEYTPYAETDYYDNEHNYRKINISRPFYELINNGVDIGRYDCSWVDNAQNNVCFSLPNSLDDSIEDVF